MRNDEIKTARQALESIRNWKKLETLEKIIKFYLTALWLVPPKYRKILIKNTDKAYHLSAALIKDLGLEAIELITNQKGPRAIEKFQSVLTKELVSDSEDQLLRANLIYEYIFSGELTYSNYQIGMDMLRDVINSEENIKNELILEMLPPLEEKRYNAAISVQNETPLYHPVRCFDFFFGRYAKVALICVVIFFALDKVRLLYRRWDNDDLSWGVMVYCTLMLFVGLSLPFTVSQASSKLYPSHLIRKIRIFTASGRIANSSVPKMLLLYQPTLQVKRGHEEIQFMIERALKKFEVKIEEREKKESAIKLSREPRELLPYPHPSPCVERKPTEGIESEVRSSTEDRKKKRSQAPALHRQPTSSETKREINISWDVRTRAGNREKIGYASRGGMFSNTFTAQLKPERLIWDKKNFPSDYFVVLDFKALEKHIPPEVQDAFRLLLIQYRIVEGKKNGYHVVKEDHVVVGNKTFTGLGYRGLVVKSFKKHRKQNGTRVLVSPIATTQGTDLDSQQKTFFLATPIYVGMHKS
jgi:hypothetical protein